MYDNNTGIVLHEEGGKFSYTRIPTAVIPWKRTKFQITTEGMIYTSFNHPSDPLEFDKMVEISTSEGVNLFNIDIKGTVKFNTPISIVITGKDGSKSIREYPNMPYSFYLRLKAALYVYKMFIKDDKEKKFWKDDALHIWSEQFVNYVEEKDYRVREVYVDEICKRKINKIFEDDPTNRDEAIELFEKGAIKTDMFLSPIREIGYELRKKLKELKAELDQNSDAENFRREKQDNRTPEEIMAQQEAEKRKNRGITRTRRQYNGPDLE